MLRPRTTPPVRKRRLPAGIGEVLLIQGLVVGVGVLFGIQKVLHVLLRHRLLRGRFLRLREGIRPDGGVLLRGSGSSVEDGAILKDGDGLLIPGAGRGDRHVVKNGRGRFRRSRLRLHRQIKLKFSENIVNRQIGRGAVRIVFPGIIVHGDPCLFQKDIGV